jgi:hypothetical protein
LILKRTLGVTLTGPADCIVVGLPPPPGGLPRPRGRDLRFLR